MKFEKNERTAQKGKNELIFCLSVWEDTSVFARTRKPYECDECA